ncbi:MAG: hypothetical protein ABIN58_13835, partial [candidate division WOR-3 bacterium]
PSVTLFVRQFGYKKRLDMFGCLTYNGSNVLNGRLGKRFVLVLDKAQTECTRFEKRPLCVFGRKGTNLLGGVA